VSLATRGSYTVFVQDRDKSEARLEQNPIVAKLDMSCIPYNIYKVENRQDRVHLQL